MLRPNRLYTAVITTLSLLGLAKADESGELRRAVTLPAVYVNPLQLFAGNFGAAISCPDPETISQAVNGVNIWYLYCTGDPLNSNDTNADGSLRNHYITSYQSIDLVHWSYIGDIFDSAPVWVTPNSALWAPAVKYFNGLYYCYYAAPSTTVPGGGSAVGVATSLSPAGPWTDSGQPLIPPSGRETIDPDVIADDTGQLYISFGSFYGGISIEQLSSDGLTADPATIEQIAIDNRFEGGSFYKRNGYYYLFMSTSNCCNGPLTGYTVFVARAKSPLGPFLDQNGASILNPNAGGTIAIAANGNTWVGPGGNVVFADETGRTYMLYHAVDQRAPYFPSNPGFTRRPALIDPIDWIDDWPSVRSGYGASDTPQPAPAAQPGEPDLYQPPAAKANDQPGPLISALSDNFDTSTLSERWHFIHPEADNSYLLTGSSYQVVTRGADENSDPVHVSILAEPVPAEGDYLVETLVRSSVPFDYSCCYNYAQPALFIYGDDQNSIKIDEFPNWDTRQTEFGKQEGPVPAEFPTYGSSVIGSPGPATYLRIAVHRSKGLGESYTGYSSLDGVNWVRSSTWDHTLGAGAQIGIAAENTVGFTVDFDYVRVYQLAPAATE